MTQPGIEPATSRSQSGRSTTEPLCRSYVMQSYLSKTCCGSSSTPGFSRSSRVASGLSFHSSSNLLICWAEICLALNCSCSEGTFTSQGRNWRSWINGCHCEGSLYKTSTFNEHKYLLSCDVVIQINAILHFLKEFCTLLHRRKAHKIYKRLKQKDKCNIRINMSSALYAMELSLFKVGRSSKSKIFDDIKIKNLFWFQNRAA